MDIKEITSEEAMNIIETRKPLGLFWERDRHLYIAIDNNTGDAWIEEFLDKQKCFDYLNGEDLEY